MSTKKTRNISSSRNKSEFGKKSQRKDKKKRRSMVERANEIFEFIDKQFEVFPKSRLKEIGINPTSAENWLTLIEFIQNQPRIRLIKSENNLLVEKVEGNYQAMIRRVITDESISFEDRSTLLSNYLPSLITRERIELERYRNKSKNNIIKKELPRGSPESSKE